MIATIPAQTGCIIDLGCGDGVYTAEFAEAFPLAYIEANDPAQEAIDMAQQRFPHITFRVTNILDLATQPTTLFDVAVILGVIHHLSDNTQKLAIQNARAIAKMLIIVEPNGNNPILKLIEKTLRITLPMKNRALQVRPSRVGVVLRAGMKYQSTTLALYRFSSLKSWHVSSISFSPYSNEFPL